MQGLPELPVRLSLFPTSRAISEPLQIGRTGAIDQLLAWALAGTNVLLLEERRIGKSSVALAVLDRIRNAGDGTLALHADLRDGVGDSVALVRKLLDQAATQDAGTRITALAAKNKLARNVNEKVRRQIRLAGTLLGVDNEIATILDLGEALTPGRTTSLSRALNALDAHGRITGNRVVVFIDEIQDLLKWGDATQTQSEIRAVARRRDGTLAFIFAGSDPTARELFEPGAKLDFVGERYELPAISLEAWQEGLQTRFQQAGYDISPEQIAQIYLATDGHPQLTMSVCAHTILWADDPEATAITRAIVRRAITAAKKHPSRVGS
jgi:3D (Asp-Asp-Asp) domain-containing protein